MPFVRKMTQLAKMTPFMWVRLRPLDLVREWETLKCGWNWLGRGCRTGNVASTSPDRVAVLMASAGIRVTNLGSQVFRCAPVSVTLLFRRSAVPIAG